MSCSRPLAEFASSGFRTNTLLTILCYLAVAVVGGCGGGGGGSSVTAPSGLSYSGSASLTVGTTASLTPSVTGMVTTWSVSPALPAGLGLNTSTGVISGTPTSVAASTSFTVTASNAGGQTTTVVQLSVALGASNAANATAAMLNASYDVSTQEVTLSWFDTFPAGGKYDVQQQNSDGSWTTLSATRTTNLQGPQGTYSWTSNPSTAAATFRVLADFSTYIVTLATVSAAQQIQVVPPTSMPSMIIGGSQPIAVPTPVYLANASTYAEVDYVLPAAASEYTSLELFGTSKVGPSYRVALDPIVLPAGTYTLQAHLIVNADLKLVISQTIQTKPEILALIQFNALTGNVTEYVTAKSDFGITQVSSTMDGTSTGTLTAPNCNNCTMAGGQLYAFTMDTAAFGSGPHTLFVTITDGNGVVGTITQQVVFNNPPKVNITSPVDGAIVFGTLNLNGTATSDKTGTVTTVVTLAPVSGIGSTQLLSTTNTSFSASYDLSNVTPGGYTLTVISTDATGFPTTIQQALTVASSQTLVYTPTTLPAGARVVATDQTTFLYSLSDGTYHLRAGSSDTVLQNTDQMSGFVIAGGNVFGSGLGKDRTGANFSIYEWSPGGVRTNLSIVGQSNGINDELVAAHDGWVVWARDSASYEFYNYTNSQTLVVTPPAGVGTVCNWRDDFFINQGQLAFFYCGETAPGSYDILRWDQVTGLSTPVTTDGSGNLYPQTDAVSLAWQSSPSPSCVGCQLNVMNLAASTRQVLSQTLSNFSLADGLLVWKEAATTGGGVKVYDGTTTTVLSARLSSSQFGSGGGHVIYEDNSKLYTWSPAHGSQLLFDGVAEPFIGISGSVAFFTSGSALYRVTVQ